MTTSRPFTLAFCVFVVGVFVAHHLWVLAVGVGLYAARRAIGWFAAWARGQRLLREGLRDRCEAQHAALTRGDVRFGTYGDYPPF